MLSVCQRYTWPMCQTVIQGELVVKFFVQWLLSKNEYDTYQNHSIPILENNIRPTLTKFPILKENFKLWKTCFNSGWTLILTIWLEKRITLKVPTILYRCTLFCVYKINFKKAFNILAKDSIVYKSIRFTCINAVIKNDTFFCSNSKLMSFSFSS